MPKQDFSAAGTWREGIATLNRKIQSEHSRKVRFGEVRPVIHADFKGYKVVAAGSRLYYGRKWRTFPDFLSYYIKSILGDEWGKAELAKPLEERHQIMKWYDATCRFQQNQKAEKDGLYSAVPSGSMRAFLLLAYDLYILRHHGALQDSILRRLKHPDQFQGARHELFAVATCIRAGYEIAFEDEGDPSRKHPEFVATHQTTGQRIAVEAKSRHRPGVLGRPGVVRTTDVRAGIGSLLKDALHKPVSYPYVIFFDLNLPPSPGPLVEKPWFSEITSSLARLSDADGEDQRDAYNLIAFTNQPDHYSLSDDPAPQGHVLSVVSRIPRIPVDHPDSILAIDDAARKYGTIPNSFEEGS